MLSHPSPRVLFFACLLALLPPAAAGAQTQQTPQAIGVPVQVSGRSYPSTAYFTAFNFLYDGNYKAAYEAFRLELAGAYHTLQNRWIDSICDYTMIGECEYRLGHYTAALENYRAALQLYVQYGGWMQQTRFNDVLGAVSGNRPPPWGRSTRGSRPAQMPDSASIMIGQNMAQMQNTI